MLQPFPLIKLFIKHLANDRRVLVSCVLQRCYLRVTKDCDGPAVEVAGKKVEGHVALL